MKLARTLLALFALVVLFSNAFAVMAPEEFSQRMDNVLLVNSYYSFPCIDPLTGKEIQAEGSEACQKPNPTPKVNELESLYSKYYSAIDSKDLEKARQELEQVVFGLDELQKLLSPEVDLTELKSTLFREYSFYEKELKRSGSTTAPESGSAETTVVSGTPGPAASTAPQPEEATVPVPLVGQMPLSMVALFIISLVLVLIVGLFLLYLTKKA